MKGQIPETNVGYAQCDAWNAPLPRSLARLLAHLLAVSVTFAASSLRDATACLCRVRRRKWPQAGGVKKVFGFTVTTKMGERKLDHHQEE
eukprot:1139364-Rhodomonas_salina.1